MGVQLCLSLPLLGLRIKCMCTRRGWHKWSRGAVTHITKSHKRNRRKEADDICSLKHHFVRIKTNCNEHPEVYVSYWTGFRILKKKKHLTLLHGAGEEFGGLVRKRCGFAE